jgi:hypothetical protein
MQANFQLVNLNIIIKDMVIKDNRLDMHIRMRRFRAILNKLRDIINKIKIRIIRIKAKVTIIILDTQIGTNKSTKMKNLNFRRHTVPLLH